MKTSKYSNRTKIIIMIWFLFTIPFVISSFTEIIEKKPIYHWVCTFSVLGWMISMYFDGKNKHSN
jgi:hypothetical protein